MGWTNAQTGAKTKKQKQLLIDIVWLSLMFTGAVVAVFVVAVVCSTGVSI